MHKYSANARQQPLNCKHKNEENIFVWVCKKNEWYSGRMSVIEMGYPWCGDQYLP